jgi:hypothetical protein
VSDDWDFDLAAAGVRADGADELTSVEVLARKLEQALPGRCQVRRRSLRFLSRDKRVEAIAVDLGDWEYALSSDGRNVAATRGQTVRGVTIKREQLSLADWVRSLAGHLHELSQSSAEAKGALDRLLG